MLKRKITNNNNNINKKIKILIDKEELLKSAAVGNSDVLKKILDKKSFDYNLVVDRESNNILHLAVKNNNLLCVQEILKKSDFLVNEINNENETPLDIVINKLKKFNYNNNNKSTFFNYISITMMILIFNEKNNFDIDEYKTDFLGILNKMTIFINNVKDNIVDKENLKELNEAIQDVIKNY